MAWVFPKLFGSRLPRYEAIARQYGYTVEAADLNQVQDEAGFIQLISQALA